jgi:energy-coupling factor transporter ATP-binding protein EcfA2
MDSPHPKYTAEAALPQQTFDTKRAPGLEVLPQHQQQLEASGISRHVAALRGYRSIVRKSELKNLGFPPSQQLVPTLLIPMWDVTGSVGQYHHRPDVPRMRDGKVAKYEFAARSHMVVDVHPLLSEKVRDPRVPLFITEGVKKADSAISKGLCCIALAGTWNWRGTNELGGKTVLPDWDAIALKDVNNVGRQVYLCFDSDVMLKPQVYQALVRLSAFLKQRGARLAYIYLPFGDGAAKMGLDDYLASGHSTDDLLLLATTEIRTPAGEDKSTDAEDANALSAEEIAALRDRARPVLESPDPLALVEEAIRGSGYGGEITPAVLVYLAATSRVLAMRLGALPVHALLLGPAGSGKSHALKAATRLLPPEAYHVIDAGSPSVLIYDDAPLQHRMVVFGEADSLPASEESPAASAVRNLCQDHHLHYKVTVRDPETGGFRVQTISKTGPTVLVTTSTRRLGAQLDSRLFTIEVADDQNQIRAALSAQARLEVEGGTAAPDALLAYQSLLQAGAPWDVVVPFAGTLAKQIGKSPAVPRLARDFARLVSLIKAVAVLRHSHRTRTEDGRLVATIADYRAIYDRLGDVYAGSVSGGASRKIREVVEAVKELRESGHEPITVASIVAHLVDEEGYPRLHKVVVSRRVKVAERGGWLVNNSLQRNSKDLQLGEELPSDEGLPSPDQLLKDEPCNNVTPFTVTDTAGKRNAGAQSAAEHHNTRSDVLDTVKSVTLLHERHNGHAKAINCVIAPGGLCVECAEPCAFAQRHPKWQKAVT